MPIDIDRFEDTPDTPTSQRVVRFLAANDDRAFRRGEIAEAIDADSETVGTNLTRLKERGLVRHRVPYWAFTDDRERAVETLAELYGTAFVEDALGNSTGDSNGDSPSGDRETHHEAATEFRDRVESELEAVEALYLFGSVPGGTATADSDLDVIALVAEAADYATVDDRLLDLAFDVQLAYDVRIEVHSMTVDEFATRVARGDPFVRAVVEEGRQIVDGSNRD